MWTPDKGAVDQLRGVFAASLALSAKSRAAASDALASARASPDFANYLCFLLVDDSESPAATRAAAGLNLKNHVIQNSNTPPSAYILSLICRGLLSEDLMVRNITALAIAALYRVANWPEAIPTLCNIIQDSGSLVGARESAAAALCRVCEDNLATMERQNGVVAAVAGFTASSAADTQLLASARASCVTAFTLLLALRLQEVIAELDRFLLALFGAASDANAKLRRSVCTALMLVLEVRPDKVLPHLEGVVQFCIHCLDDDEEVAMEACEFLLALAEMPDSGHRVLVRPVIATLLPHLLSKMVYLEEQVFLMGLADEKDDLGVADRAEDIKPQTARGKTHAVKKKTHAGAEAGSDSDSDSDSESDDDDFDSLDSWNLRRCAAATLDALSLHFPEDIVAGTLPLLTARILAEEWPTREAAILAFGAISKSCISLAPDQLPTLVPFLVDRLKDPQPRVRQITCWALSRYLSWVCEEAHAGGTYSTYFQPTFEAIVLLTLDPKKVVQEASCLALSSFVETADIELIAYYLGPLLQHFAKCLQLYQRKNMLVLYDCVGTFVEKIGQDRFVASPDHANTLLPPLLRSWEALLDDDDDLWPLLECMSIVAATMGETFAPYAVPVYERAVKILANAITLNRETHTHPEIEAPEKDFIVTSLDLIDGLVQGFKEHAVELLQQHSVDVMQLVLACFEDHDDDVRQLAYALLGDLAIFAYSAIVAPSLPEITRFVGSEVSNCTYSSFAATNNAIWAYGELALRAQPELLVSFLPSIVDLMVPVLNSTEAQLSVVENAAICIGRLGLCGALPILAPRLAEFIHSWCAQIMYVEENEEKETAFKGMLSTVQQNPDAGFGGLSNQQGKKNLSVFLSCIGNYFEPPEDLKHGFFQTLTSYKAMLGADWDAVVGLVDGETRAFLHTTYGV